MERFHVAVGVQSSRYHLPQKGRLGRPRDSNMDDCQPLLTNRRIRLAERRWRNVMMSGLNCVESCLTCHLRSGGFFCDLSPGSIEDFNKIKHAAVFPEHAAVLVEGQSPCGVFILCQGRVKLSTTSREGKTLIVRIAEAGEVLGLHAVVTGAPYELTAETMQPCQLNFVGREDLLHFLQGHADAALHATPASGARLFGRLRCGADDRAVTLGDGEVCAVPTGKRLRGAGQQWQGAGPAGDDP